MSGRLLLRRHGGRLPGEPDDDVEPLPPLLADVLALQRSAGNHAVAGLLQRDEAPAAAPPAQVGGTPFSPFAPVVPDFTKPPQLGYDPDADAAIKAIEGYVDRLLARFSIGTPTESVGEIAAAARAQPYTTRAGTSAVVGDKVTRNRAEEIVRQRAADRKRTLKTERGRADPSTVAAKAADLGLKATPDSSSDKTKVVVKVDGRVSTEVEGGGVKAEASVGRSEAKAKFELGSHFILEGGVKPDDEGHWKLWSAKITFGTEGEIVTPAEITELLSETKKTFEKGALSLQKGHGAAILNEHAAEMRKAVEEIVETGRKRAKEKGGGLSVSAGVERKETGETIGTITFTWSF